MPTPFCCQNLLFKYLTQILADYVETTNILDLQFCVIRAGFVIYPTYLMSLIPHLHICYILKQT